MSTRSDVLAVLKVMLPPLVWFACLSLLYSAVTLACVWGQWLLPLAAAVVVGLMAVRERDRESRRFLTILSRCLCGIVILAMIWLMLPLLILEAC